MKPRIPISRPDIGPLEQENVREAMASKWLTQGPFVHEAESRLKEITGRKYALCVSSGTTALIVALMATDTGWRPRVVAAPALTFAAVHNAIKLTGGTVHYQDAALSTWQVNESELRGMSFDDAIAAPCYGKVAISRDLRYATRGNMIEDAAESFGGSMHGLPAGGSDCAISCISFYANKICTAGEGGAVLTNDESLYEKMKLIINHGIGGKDYVSQVPGLNGRMTDLQAAILCAQLERMPEMIRRRGEIWHRLFTAAGGFWRGPVLAAGEVRAPWLFAGIPHSKYSRSEIIAACEKENIEWRPFFPVPQITATHRMTGAKRLSNEGLCLPLSSALTDDEVERICEVLRG